MVDANELLFSLLFTEATTVDNRAGMTETKKEGGGDWCADHFLAMNPEGSLGINSSEHTSGTQLQHAGDRAPLHLQPDSMSSSECSTIRPCLEMNRRRVPFQ